MTHNKILILLLLNKKRYYIILYIKDLFYEKNIFIPRLVLKNDLIWQKKPHESHAKK